MIPIGFTLLLISLQACLVRCNIHVEISPKNAIVLPGERASFLCKVGVPIIYCRVTIPGQHPLNLAPDIPASNGVSYFGEGLEFGQCGATIERVTEANNGWVNCSVGTRTSSRESGNSMKLTVAVAPKVPMLDLSRGHDSHGIYKADEVVQASCIVRDGRPPANISWYLDEEKVTEGLIIPTIIDDANHDLSSVIQNMTRRLRVTDNGKQLRCVAEHPALPNRERQVSRQLDIKFPPQPAENPIEKFGFELNKPGTITVDILANPKPQVEWTVGDQRLREGGGDTTGRLEAPQLTDEGRGRYVATLRIASITKQDTETQFKLIAYNDQGSTDYYVVISTSPEPEGRARFLRIYGMQLEAAYIVLIVVALLVLLFVVFLLIFARATGRWCFSDNGGHHPTESSDTESVEARKEMKLKMPKLQLGAVFRRNKDKVSQEDEIATEMETDEAKQPLDESDKPQQPGKEGIVYAELDLVSQNLRPVVKNDDDKTEYAEIIYTKPEGEPEAEKLQEQKS